MKEKQKETQKRKKPIIKRRGLSGEDELLKGKLTQEKRKKLKEFARREAQKQLLEEPEFSERVQKYRSVVTEQEKEAKKLEEETRPLTAPRKWEAARDAKEKKEERKASQEADQAAIQAAAAEILLTDEPGYIRPESNSTASSRTTSITQNDIVDVVDVRSARKAFNLNLDTFGPYSIDYTRSGRHLLLAGKKGHISVLDWERKKLISEFHVEKTVNDAVFLHNETMIALAESHYLHIYDTQGTELHCLRNFRLPLALEFLPYHFLLAESGGNARLRYIDTSTGAQVADWPTHMGPAPAMCQNPWNAVILLGHGRGIVSMWSPNQGKPLCKLIAHHGTIASIAVDQGGFRMATSGSDGFIKVWDIRALKPLASFKTKYGASSTMSISQRGLLAFATGPHVEIWGKDALDKGVSSPYLSHVIPGSIIQEIKFCPFEDFLGVGHSVGFSSVVVPGAGEPNYDTFEANPYQTKKQRKEAEVHSLLEKIPSALISLVPGQVGRISQDPIKVRTEKRWKQDRANKTTSTTERDDDDDDDDDKKLIEKAKRDKNRQKRKEQRKKKPKKCVIFEEKDQEEAAAAAAALKPRKEVVSHVDSALDLFTKKVVY